MRSIFIAFCVCGLLAACAQSTALPPLPQDTANASPRTGQPPPVILTPSAGSPSAGSTPVNTFRGAPISASNPSTAIVAINRSVPQPLGPNSPPPSSFENTCAPAPYLFQSKAGYEAVRVKDCRNDQLLYMPTSAQTLINAYVEECQRRCGGQ